MPEIPPPQFLSVPDAARICGVSRNTVYAWVRQGKLGAYQTPGRTNLIRPSDLVKFMHQNGMFVPSSLVDLARRDDKNHGVDAPRETDVKQHEVTVLVADDDPISRSLMVRAVHEMSHALQAETGYEALHLLTLHRDIDVVMLDLRMPGQHGLETLSEVQELRPDVAVIIVTGFLADIPPEVLKKPCIVRTIEKPFAIRDLQDAMRAAIERQKERRRAALPAS